MNQAPIELSLVIPMFNEEPCCRLVVEDQLAALENLAVPYELIVINNGSTDRTGEILEDLRRAHSRLKVVSFPVNHGYGGAVLAGMNSATGKFIGFTCGDGEVPADAALKMYRLLKTGAGDLCKAKRVGRRDGLWRSILSFGYHLAVSFALRIHISDLNGYPVVMSAETFRDLRISETSWIFNLDMLVRCRRAGRTMIEVDVPHLPRAGGHTKVTLVTPLMFLFQLIRYAAVTAGRIPSRANGQRPAIRP